MVKDWRRGLRINADREKTDSDSAMMAIRLASEVCVKIL